MMEISEKHSASHTCTSLLMAFLIPSVAKAALEPDVVEPGVVLRARLDVVPGLVAADPLVLQVLAPDAGVPDAEDGGGASGGQEGVQGGRGLELHFDAVGRGVVSRLETGNSVVRDSSIGGDLFGAHMPNCRHEPDISTDDDHSLLFLS